MVLGFYENINASLNIGIIFITIGKRKKKENDKKKNPLKILYETFIKKKYMYGKIVAIIDNLTNQ